MPLDTLAERLITLPAVKRLLNEMTSHKVALQFSSIVDQPSPNPFNWNYLLLVASLLVRSADVQCQDNALRIAAYVLTNVEATDLQRSAAGIILGQLWNDPSIRLAQMKGLLNENYLDELPTMLQLEALSRDIERRVTVSSAEPLTVNRFQLRLWLALEKSQFVSASAPTSAGKSFIIKRWLANQFAATRIQRAIYLAPTRALVQEIETELKQMFMSLKIPISIISMPLPELIKPGRVILIMTQERLHYWLLRSPEWSADLLVADEAQKVGDGYRGVLLEQVLQVTRERNPKLAFIYAVPGLDNPEVLVEGEQEPAVVSSDEVTVSQNLIWINQVPRKPREFNVVLMKDDTPQPIGKIVFSDRLTPESKRLSYIAHELGSNSGSNLVYVGGPADAEKVAIQIAHRKEELGARSTDQEIGTLIDLVKTVIHPRYCLVEALKYGVAFHYGNMPLIVKSEIERLFGMGVIEFLVCTSTLMEGVNLPCRNLFLRGPSKGRGKPLNEVDFWNLAGRAGRWGKEFQGNIFCIDPLDRRVWEEEPPVKKALGRIKRTTDRVLGNAQSFIDYLHRGAPQQIDNLDMEYTFSYLAAEWMRKGNLNDITRLKVAEADEICDAVRAALGEDPIPLSILERNPGISPIAMRGLLTEMRTIEDKNALLPTLPESQDAVDVYRGIFEMINSHFGTPFGLGNGPLRFALLVTNWMKGKPLAVMIEAWLRYLREHGRSVSLQSEIRKVMFDVEQYARFVAPKYLGCYRDVLELNLVESGQQQLVQELTDLSISLEFGVAIKTQMSLMLLGLSRTAALAVSELLPRSEMTPEQCTRWLRSRDLETLPFSPVLIREIRTALDWEAMFRQ